MFSTETKASSGISRPLLTTETRNPSNHLWLHSLVFLPHICTFALDVISVYFNLVFTSLVTCLFGVDTEYPKCVRSKKKYVYTIYRVRIALTWKANQSISGCSKLPFYPLHFFVLPSSTKNSSGLLLAINYVGRNQFCYSLFPGFLTNFCEAAKS